MPRVLLVAKDWKFRTLLRAHLREEGLEVNALADAREALNGLTTLADLPKLLVADLTGSAHPSAEADLLARWTSILPIWLIVSRTLTLERVLEGLGFNRVIYRPVDVGRLAREIKEWAES